MSSQSVLDLVRNKREAIDKQKASQTPVLRPAVGKHKYRFLPGWRGNGDSMFFHDFGLHYIKKTDPATGKMVLDSVYICTKRTYDRECLVCDAINQGIQAATSDAVVELLKEAKSSQKYLLNVLHLTGDKPDKVQLMEIGPKLFDQLCDIIGEHDDITSLTTGKDVIINRSGSGLDTTYTMTVAANSAPVKLKSELVNIDAVVSQEAPSGLQKALGGVMRAQGRAPVAIAAAAPRAAAALESIPADEPDAFEEAVLVQTADTPEADELDELLNGL